MRIYINNEIYEYEIKTYLRIFFPDKEFVFTYDKDLLVDLEFQIEDDQMGLVYYEDQQMKYESFFGKEHPLITNLPIDEKQRVKGKKRLIKQLIYNVATNISGKKVPWGILTGVRPTKVVFDLINQYGKDKNKIKQVLRREYKITDDKIKLMLDVVDKEGKILDKNKADEVSLYIGIPFCPSRCIYCSFPSYPIGKNKNNISGYLDALKRELDFVVRKAIKNKPIRSIYIGGGTPTSLNELQLESLLEKISRTIDISKVSEFTVEAGRPDTITKEKLEILKKYGVHRISINPQTMNQQTLDIIGRSHKVDDIFTAFNMAKSYGFDVNMDVIIGLAGESSTDVLYTMEQFWKIKPDNVTVHTLAIKRGSQLHETFKSYRFASAEEIEHMLEITSRQLELMGLNPYYMYRQKNMIGNYENVGYAQVGKECIYNVEIIEEKQTIWAIGAGATSKIVSKDKMSLNRIENVKNITDYINRIDEMINRKKQYL